MNLRTAFVLGRVSNLPTVWTNVLTAAVLCALPLGGAVQLGFLMLAMSLFYVSGMYLNDYFDAEWDAQHNPGRPLPAGQCTKTQVLLFALIFLCLALMLILASATFKLSGLFVSLVLFAFICLYDWKHKSWPLIAPLLMGACRLLVYLTVGICLVGLALPLEVSIAGIALMLYIAGITALARAEHDNRLSSAIPLVLLLSPVAYSFYLGYEKTSSFLLSMFLLAWIMRAVHKVFAAKPGAIGQAVAALLAGICLVDAALIAAVGHLTLAWWAIVGFVLCLVFQKFIPAT